MKLGRGDIEGSSVDVPMSIDQEEEEEGSNDRITRYLQLLSYPLLHRMVDKGYCIYFYNTSPCSCPYPSPCNLCLAPAAPISAPATTPVSLRIGKGDLRTNEKLELPISLDNLAPNGIHADLFASEMGIVTRQNAPLDVEKWSQVEDDVKQKICDLVLEKFDIADTQEKSLRNKDNRKHHIVPHIIGRRTFQVVRRDHHHPRTGVEPDIQELWQISHQKNNGEWVNEKAKQIDDDISCMINESYDSKNSITPNEAFLLVRGEKSDVSYGIKASKSKLRIQAQLQEAMQDREELTKEIDVLKKKLEEQQTQ
ncbi:hypothetical protein Ahy_B06g081962 [Arachis hypogaea]|uniref:Uncharacterized protein n=1 Tax=Arachis hypogaea TaxID=3818 RepID=A0A444YMM2_ARAHY|nr:hypothetical protein Ahy_B06g081962 [Arachis hypogaea]